MNTVRNSAASLYAKFIRELKEQPLLFASVWLTQFSIVALLLISLGIAPSMLLADAASDEPLVSEAVKEIEPPTIVDTEHVKEMIHTDTDDSAPVRIMIDAIDVDTSIENPTVTNIEVLDEALTQGAVHYPGSGNLEDETNMFLFGHSSGLPVVHNQAYKAFNDLAKLEKGDLIRVQSETKEYHYRVQSVEKIKAEDAWVAFDTGEKQLTLSTCNNFGSKQDRFVVHADYLGSFALELDTELL